MNKKQRDKNRTTAELNKIVKLRPCPNCGRLTNYGHFVPPGFGDAGHYICYMWEE